MIVDEFGHGRLKFATSAVNTTYDMALSLSVLAPNGVEDTVSRHLRREALLTAKHNDQPLGGHDLGLVRQGLCLRVPLPQQTLGMLISTIVILSRSLSRCDRVADIHATVITPANVRQWDIEALHEVVTISIYMSKTAKKTQQDTYYWSTDVVRPLRMQELRAAFGWSRDQAHLVASRCWLATAWKCYFNLLFSVFRQRLEISVVGGRRIYSRNSLVYADTLTRMGDIRFLGRDRLSKLVKEFHLAHVGDLPTSKGYVTYWWRHFTLSALHMMGLHDEVLRLSGHTTINTFLKHYNVPTHEACERRWRAVKHRQAFIKLPSQVKLLL